MAALLRVAIAMDRNHDGGVQFVTTTDHGEDLEIRLHARDDRDLDLECFTAADRSSLLEELLGQPVRVRSAGDGDG